MAKGKNELDKYLDGKRITFRQACIAKCYDCMGGYTDGKFDCDIADCPIHPFMPYRNQKESSGYSENHIIQEFSID